MGYIFSIESSNSDLQHHGIMGQKWGVRRFQNKDGTRTAAGKRRERQDNKKETKNKKVDISEMSNEELQKLVTRMNLEKQYNSLKDSEINRGFEYVDRVLSIGGAALGVAGGVLAITSAVKNHKNLKGAESAAYKGREVASSLKDLFKNASRFR